METNKESSFVREIESRLNVLFGEDFDKSNAKKDAESKSVHNRLDEVSYEPQAETGYKTAEKTDSDSEALHVHESLKEISVEPQIETTYVKEGGKDFVTESTAETAKGSDFVREIEDRLNVLFPSEDKTRQPDLSKPSQMNLQEIVPSSEESTEDKPKEERFEKLYGDMDATVSIMYSPLKELKGIILSIEWEISEPILEKFDREINHLYELYSEDRIVLGFLQILRFLGRFIRTKEADADAGSIKLLLFIYDDLESVVLSNTLTMEAKQAMLAEDIKKYKSWVETADLAVRGDGIREHTRVRPEPEDAELDDEWISEREKESDSKAPLLSLQKRAAHAKQTSQLMDEESDTLAKIKDLTPHEVLAYALDELRKTIVAEFAALRADLKLWQQGQ